MKQLTKNHCKNFALEEEMAKCIVCLNVIAAEGEHKASRALRHAAEVIVDSPAALQVWERNFIYVKMPHATKLILF